MMRQQQQVVPVYMVCGMLESGKTTMIHTMLKDEGFSRYEPETLIISCEEGEEEYDPATLEECKARLVTLDDPDQLTSLQLKKWNTEYRPERVIIEYNTMWGLQRLGGVNLPPNWEYVQVITLADAGTFDNYMKNLRQPFTDPMKEADLILVNRCTPESPKSSWRRQIKAFNKNVNILFENPDGSTEDGVADEDLPYDMKADPVSIDEKDLGTFYLDSLDHPDRYDGKRVTLVGIPYPDRDMPNGYYLFGREAMTCCANDIAKIGWVTQGLTAPSTRKYMRLTARCQKMTSRDGSQSVLMMQEESCVPASAPKEKYVTFS